MDFIDGYFKNILKLDDAIRKQIMTELKERNTQGQLPTDIDGFVNQVYFTLVSRYPLLARRLEVANLIKENIKTIYQFYRLTDESLWGEFTPIKTKLQQSDNRAQEFLARLDEIYFSRYVTNEDFKNELTNFLRDEIMAKGFQATDAVLDEFGTAWANNSELQVRRIIDTSATRVRTFAHIRQMRQAGIQELEIVEVMDRIACAVCRQADGKTIKVAVADDLVEQALGLPPEQFQSRYITGVATEFQMMTTPIDDLVAQGKGLPPIHPLCRGRIIAHFRLSLSDYEKENGTLPEEERYGEADYSEYGKELKLPFMNQGKLELRNQTIICSDTDIFRKKVYLTQESIQHIIKDHLDDSQRQRVLNAVFAVVGRPDRIYVESYYDELGKRKLDTETKIYFSQIRGQNYAVCTRRGGPEVIWTAFTPKEPSPRWELIWRK